MYLYAVGIIWVKSILMSDVGTGLLNRTLYYPGSIHQFYFPPSSIILHVSWEKYDHALLISHSFSRLSKHIQEEEEKREEKKSTMLSLAHISVTMATSHAYANVVGVYLFLVRVPISVGKWGNLERSRNTKIFKAEYINSIVPKSIIAHFSILMVGITEKKKYIQVRHHASGLTMCFDCC